MAFSFLGETDPSRSFPCSWCKLSVDSSSFSLEFVSTGLNERGVSSSFCYEEKKMHMRLHTPEKKLVGEEGKEGSQGYNSKILFLWYNLGITVDALSA